MSDHETKLRRLAIHDERLYGQALCGSDTDPPRSLDARSSDIARLAALIASDAPETTYAPVISAGLGDGLTPDELVDVLIAVIPIVGSARAGSAAPRLAAALDYDLERGLEDLGPTG